MRLLLTWVGVNCTTSCEKSVNKSVIVLEKLRGALQIKMTATCGIQKFRWREKIKHLSKYWGGVVNTGRPLQVKYWGGEVATLATPAALTLMVVVLVPCYNYGSRTVVQTCFINHEAWLYHGWTLVPWSVLSCNSYTGEFRQVTGSRWMAQ